jgi:hypothetical protein
MNARNWYGLFLLWLALLFGAGLVSRVGAVAGYVEEKNEKELSELTEKPLEAEPSDGFDELPPLVDGLVPVPAPVQVSATALFYDQFYYTRAHELTYRSVSALRASFIGCKKPTCGLEVLFRLLLI